MKGDHGEVLVKKEEEFFDLTELVRSLQRAEGIKDCFRLNRDACDRPDCPWQSLCLKKPDNAEKS